MIEKYKDYDLGSKQVNGLIPEMLEAWLFALAGKYSKNSIDRAWTIIKQSIEYGQKNGLVSKDLAVKNVRKPNEQNVAVKKKEVQFATMPDMEILYKEAYKVNSKGKPVYGSASKVLVFIMYSGIRASEAIAPARNTRLIPLGMAMALFFSARVLILRLSPCFWAIRIYRRHTTFISTYLKRTRLRQL